MENANAIDERDEKFLAIAVEEALKGAECGDGEPFGAVVTRDGEIVVRSHNLIKKNFDSTAHAEITAIREACEKLKVHDLSGCELYASCEPCPMCFGAIYFSKIKRLVYGAKAEVLISTGFSTPFSAEGINGAEHSQKDHVEIKKGKGKAAVLAEQIFLNPK